MINLIPRLEFLAQSLFRQQSYCPHCNSQNLTQIARKYVFVRITQCNNCNLYFTDPIYKPLFISNIYNHLYSAEGHTTSLPEPDELASLKSQCFESSDKYFAERIQSIKNSGFGQNLLEIGSSWGYFLYQAKQQGFDVTGVEISEPRRLFGINNLGVDIVGSVQDLNDRAFDIIYTAHTLEHFTDLSTIFKELSGLLHVGGKLIIEVPNFDYTEFGKRALYTIGAIHPLGFSSEFFRENLPKYNFKLIGFYNSWESFPKNPLVKSQQDVIIVLAEKEGQTG